jgi:drug/metabolite transporter (DMT)-like permease
VPATALALTLVAALLHAGWNLLLARAGDTEGATAVALVAGLLVGAPLALAAWDIRSAAIPYLAAAAVLQLAYIALLAAAYTRAELSVVYPLARGSAPVLVLIVSAVALGASPSLTQAIGVAVVAGGVILVRGLRLGNGAGSSVALALAIGVCIAGYTLVDARGIRHAGALTYLELEMLLPALAYAGVVTRLRGRQAMRACVTPAHALAGAAMILGYGCVLLALRHASAPAVSAVRESSVVVATALAAVVLHERVTRVRMAGAAIVVAGVALVALG